MAILLWESQNEESRDPLEMALAYYNLLIHSEKRARLIFITKTKIFYLKISIFPFVDLFVSGVATCPIVLKD